VVMCDALQRSGLAHMCGGIGRRCSAALGPGNGGFLDSLPAVLSINDLNARNPSARFWLHIAAPEHKQRDVVCLGSITAERG
jgi:hypothetical protein